MQPDLLERKARLDTEIRDGRLGGSLFVREEMHSRHRAPMLERIFIESSDAVSSLRGRVAKSAGPAIQKNLKPQGPLRGWFFRVIHEKAAHCQVFL